MKRLILFLILIMSTNLKSQNEGMKRIEFEEIVMYSISDKEMNDLLINQGGVLNTKFTDLADSINVYNLNNGNVIYEMVELRSFLFDSENDLEFFLKRTVEIAHNDVKRKIEIKDENFINKKELYIQLFIHAFDISLDFKNIEDLKKVDQIIKCQGINDIIPKYNYSLVAILGEFLKFNMNNVDWKSLKIRDDLPVRYVIFGGQHLHDPSVILENIIYHNSNFKKNIEFYKTVKSILDQ